jgi:hypothetical protein
VLKSDGDGDNGGDGDEAWLFETLQPRVDGDYGGGDGDGGGEKREVTGELPTMELPQESVISHAKEDTDTDMIFCPASSSGDHDWVLGECMDCGRLREVEGEGVGREVLEVVATVTTDGVANEAVGKDGMQMAVAADGGANEEGAEAIPTRRDDSVNEKRGRERDGERGRERGGERDGEKSEEEVREEQVHTHTRTYIITHTHTHTYTNTHTHIHTHKHTHKHTHTGKGGGGEGREALGG